MLLSNVLLWWAAARAAQPSGLLTNYQAGTALGVGAVPEFGWIVPSCNNTLNADANLTEDQAFQFQTAYQIILVAKGSGTIVWDSGKVASNASANVPYGGRAAVALQPGASYTWTVTTWTGLSAPLQSPGGGCKSDVSAPQTFVTALFGGWSESAEWIWPASAHAGTAAETAAAAAATAAGTTTLSPDRFAFFRRLVNVGGKGTSCLAAATATTAAAATPPAGPRELKHGSGEKNSTAAAVKEALLFISASVDETLLTAFKLYIGGRLVAVGPGRGEAPVKGGDSKFSSSTYVTLDVTADIVDAVAKADGLTFVLAAEGQSPMGDTRWDAWDPFFPNVTSNPPGLLVQLQIERTDNSTCKSVPLHTLCTYTSTYVTMTHHYDASL